MRRAPALLSILFAACSPRAREPVRPPSAAVTTAVAKPAQPPVTEQQQRYETDADGILYARPTKASVAEPARFSAPLPSSLAEFERPEAHPPLGQVSAGLCRGSTKARAQFLAAARQAASAGPVDAKLERAFIELLAVYCSEAEHCRWLLASIDAEPTAAVRRILYRGLEWCGAEALPAVSRDESPHELVIEFYIQGIDRTYPLKRVKAAVTALAQQRRGRELRDLGVALSAVDDVAVVSFVEEVQRSLPSDSAPWLALGLGDHPSPRARELHRKACDHGEVRNDPLCDARPSFAPAPQRPLTEGALDVMHPDFDLDRFRAKHPRQDPALIEELERCIRRAESYRRTQCFDWLAEVAWLRARAAIDHFSARDIEYDPHLGEEAVAISRFGSRRQLIDHARSIGLLSEKTSAGADESLREVLGESGRLHTFDTETGTFPNDHDVLLVELAALAEGDLDGVHFEELPPAEDQFEADPPVPYRLNAYAGGFRYEVEADNLGDWYDVTAVVGLLNALLRERGSERRYVVLDTGDQSAAVVCAPRTGLRSALKDGLLRSTSAEAAMRAGKAFEERVLRELRRAE